MRIEISDLNPLHFVEKGKVALPQFYSKHYQDWHYETTVLPWQTGLKYSQPWLNIDTIRLQVLSDVGPITATLIDAYGFPALTTTLTQKEQSFFEPTLYIHELHLALTTVPEGYYRLELKFSTLVTYESNDLYIAPTFLDPTIFVRYSHFKHKDGMFFENGFRPTIRTYGVLVYEKPGSVNVIYTDQNSDQTMLSSRTFSTMRWYIGGPEGTPDFHIPKMNKVSSCSEFRLDGRPYTRATSGAQFEEKAEEDYAMRGWSIELRDRFNRSSKIYDSANGGIDGIDGGGGIDSGGGIVPPTGGGAALSGLAVVINVEAKGFVQDDVGGSFYEVKDIE